MVEPGDASQEIVAASGQVGALGKSKSEFLLLHWMCEPEHKAWPYNVNSSCWCSGFFFFTVFFRGIKYSPHQALQMPRSLSPTSLWTLTWMLEQLFVAVQAFKVPPLRCWFVNSNTYLQICSQFCSQLVFDNVELFTEPVSLVTWLPDQFVKYCHT